MSSSLGAGVLGSSCAVYFSLKTGSCRICFLVDAGMGLRPVPLALGLCLFQPGLLVESLAEEDDWADLVGVGLLGVTYLYLRVVAQAH